MKEESSVKQVNAPVEKVYSTLSNLENLRPILEKARTDERIKEHLRAEGREDAMESLANVELTNDSIALPVPMFGTISMRIINREENKCVKFETEQSPVKANMWIQVLPVTDATSKMRLSIDADIPFMLKPMVGSKLKDGVEKLADMLSAINY